MRRLAAGAVSVAAVCAVVCATAQARVLRVGTFHGIRGQFESIQAAVDHARPGDWILIAPGDYKTTTSRHPRGAANSPAGILITTPRLYLRGMNRDTVFVDGTKPGSPRCSRRRSAQNFGPRGEGLNGIMVWKAAGVWVQNLTACNFLGGKGDTGNEIWWNGGDGSARVGGHGFYGSYMTATSTFYGGEKTAAAYGIFSSNWTGGTWDQSYASNFNDSGFYIGACQRVCDQTMDRVWAQYNSIGYSGSNSGGRMLIEHSTFDHNKDGFDTNSQNGDNPPPQDGACPPGVKPPIAGAPTCWVFYRNWVHDNNDADVPAAGLSSGAPVGTGLSISGGRDDTILDNRFANNGAWGMIVVAFPDMGKPCTGGTPNFPLLGSGSCLYDDWGDAVIGNAFSHDGDYGNPTNGDLGQLNLEPGHPTDCYRANFQVGGGGLSPALAALEQLHPRCDGSPGAVNTGGQFLDEVFCDTQVDVSLCRKSDRYPRRTRVVMHPLPHLPSMPDPCAGVPANPWCPARRHHAWG